MFSKEALKKAEASLGENVRFEGLLKKTGRLKKVSASEPGDVFGFDYTVQWENNCYEFYTANPPLIGCTGPTPVPCPLGIASFDTYAVDYKKAIELFHTGDWGGRFTAITLFKPLHPDVKEPYWYFLSDLGVQVIIGADSGEFLNK